MFVYIYICICVYIVCYICVCMYMFIGGHEAEQERLRRQRESHEMLALLSEGVSGDEREAGVGPGVLVRHGGSTLTVCVWIPPCMHVCR